jgi:hypothetical protein
MMTNKGNMTENIREPYRSGEGPGRLDIDGVEWWACDPYPTWFRWENGELFTNPAEWMHKDRRMALRVAFIESEKAEAIIAKALERVQKARAALEEVDR